MDIKPGQNVRIVTKVDLAKERISVKASVVYEVKGHTIVLAQTDPPLSKSMLHKPIVVTYLTTNDAVTARLGLPARIVEFFEYGLESGQQAQALKVESTGEPRPHNIRMFYRVVPSSHSGISVKVQGTAVNLLDLSLGGVKISHDKSLDLRPDMVVGISLEMNGTNYILEALIVRTWDRAAEGFNEDLVFAALEFMTMNRTIEQALSQKIRDIEREPIGPHSL